MAEASRAQRLAIWQALSDVSRHHRAFDDAKWALPSSDLDEIDAIAARFVPDDPIAMIRFLFDSQLPDTGTRRMDDFAAYQAALRDARIGALRPIVDAEGLPGIHRLVDSAKEVVLVGWTLAETRLEIDEDAVLAELDSQEQRRAMFALGYVRQRATSDGWPWINAVLPRLGARPTAQARVLGASHDLPEIWRRMDQLPPPVAATYWAEFAPFGLGADFSHVEETAQHLLAHGRAGTATDLLALYADRSDPPIDAAIVADVLEGLVESSPEEQRRASSYEIQRLLELLRSSSVDENRLGVLEWRLLPALGYGAPAPILERRLARDPSFFVDLLSMCFKRADGSFERDIGKEVAQNAFRLLHEWRVVPGSSEAKSTVDETRLTEWLDEAQRLLADVDRTEIGLMYIGHIFAHAREDPDGTWPTVAVRNAIERLDSNALQRGFGNEIYNKRGVTSRGLTDGGRQEYDLAERFDGWAGLIANQWPRTAAVLRSVADGYRAQGRAEDEEARRFVEGLE